MAKCGVCSYPDADKKRYNGRMVSEFECPRCGNFKMTIEAEDFFIGSNADVHIISGHIREKNLFGITPELHYKNLEEIQKYAPRPKTVTEKTDKLIEYLGYTTKFPSDVVKIQPRFDYPIIYAILQTEFEFFLDYLYKQGYVKADKPLDFKDIEYEISLTYRGFERFEEIIRTRIDSNIAFIAMAFEAPKGHSLVLNLKEVYEEAIVRAFENLPYEPLRIDFKEFNDDICDHIIADIRKCRFLIADCTYQKQNVYYEAGFAYGLGREVIWCCHDEDFQNVHFDTEHNKYIRWKTPEDLRKQLRDRIEATII